MGSQNHITEKKILDNFISPGTTCNWLLDYHHFWIIMICAIYILMSSAAYLVETSPLTAQLMKGCWRNGHGVELLRFWLLYENDLLLTSVIMYRFLPEFKLLLCRVYVYAYRPAIRCQINKRMLFKICKYLTRHCSDTLIDAYMLVWNFTWNFIWNLGGHNSLSVFDNELSNYSKFFRKDP